MIKTSIILFILFYMVSANSQQTIDKLNSNQLKLPKETIQKALSIDAAGQVKSSTTSDTELGYLSGTTSSVQTQLNSKSNDTDTVHLTGNESISGIKTFNGRLVTSSTTNASLPCPVMTQTQRDLIVSPVVGDCVFNDDVDQANIYDGSIWKSMGGSGGISLWLTATGYAVDDVVIESNKIYICLTAHTSGTFSTDLAATKWLRVSTDVSGATGVLPLTNGGTAKNITASNGAIAYSDTDSLELLTPGTSGQVLQTNGAAAPSFVNKSISAKAENGSSVTLEELQVSNNQLTQTATNKHLLNDCGSSNNLLANCGFEHSTPATGWTLTNGTSAVETSNVKQGKQSLKLTLSAQALDFYQTSTLNATAFADGVQGSIFLSIKTTVDNVYLCRTDSAGAVVASTNGVDRITNCVKISNSGKWGDYVLPVILGATSNGLRLVSLTPSTAAAVAVTGDVYVDSGILEAGLKATSQGVCTDVSCQAEFGAKVSSTDVVSDENTDWINGDCTNASTGDATCTFKTGVFSVAPNCVTTGLTSANMSCNVSSATSSAVNINCANSTTDVNTGFQLSCQKQGVDFTNAKALASGRFYTVPSDSFSTDSNTLTHKTTAIVAADPIGTYNTYSYAINTNTKTICGTAPSILPNAADGFKIFTRAYNAASTCGNPARVEIKIGAAGTKFPTIKTDIYKSAAKVTGGSLDFSVQSATVQTGARATSYDEATGVLIVDSGYADLATNTLSSFFFNDVSGQTNGFLVINAQKAKDSIIGSFAEVVTSQGTTSPDIQSVYFGSGADCETVCSTGSCTICHRVGTRITSVSYYAAGVYLLNGIDGTKYSCNGTANTGGAYVPVTFPRQSSTSSYALIEMAGNVRRASIQCIGKP